MNIALALLVLFVLMVAGFVGAFLVFTNILTVVACIIVGVVSGVVIFGITESF